MKGVAKVRRLRAVLEPSASGGYLGEQDRADLADVLDEHQRFHDALITLRQKLAEAALLDFREIAALAIAPKKETFAVSHDVLALVGRKLTRAAWRTWSERERVEAMNWAAAVHLRASDNVVRVPAIPPYVAALAEVRS